VAALGDENVRRLDVAVDDSFGVSGIQSIGDFDAESQQRFEFQGTPGNAALQRSTLQIFHGDERLAFRFANVMNGADAGMIQGRRCLCLSLKTRECLWVFRQIVG